MTEQDRVVAGRYRLGEKVGVGAMGVVWRARDERLRRTVAVKQLFIQPGLDNDRADEARQRAMREARIAARLQHQNVVIVYDVVEDDDQPWLIMEYVPSRSLATVLQQGTMPPYLVATVGAQAAAGLAAAHAVGVVHRDVKPGNVLLGDDGVVKIADFGISRAVDDVVLTATGLVTGTPAYLAPEMAKGEQPAPASDVFALGATLYAAVEGTPPFGLNENPLALLHTVAAGNVVPPANAGPLTEPLMRLLQRSPQDRPTMREAQETLAAIAAERTVQAQMPARDLLRAWTMPGVEPVPNPRTGPARTALAEAPPPPPRPPSPARTEIGVPVLPPRPRTQQRTPPRRRRPTAWLVTAIVVAVAAVGGALFLVNGAGGNGARGHTAAPPAATATSTPGMVNGQPGYQQMVALVSKYYGLLPTHQTEAYALLSPNYRRAHPFRAFAAFYNLIRSVTPGKFQAIDANTIDATLRFTTTTGRMTDEPYKFVIRANPATGALQIDNAIQLRTTGM